MKLDSTLKLAVYVLRVVVCIAVLSIILLIWLSLKQRFLVHGRNGAVMTDAAIFCATWTLRAVLAVSSLSALVVTYLGQKSGQV